MQVVEPIEAVHIATLDADGRTYEATLALDNDGIEFLGHLWFADEAWEDEGVRDHGAIPGRSVEEVVRLARSFSTNELMLRFRRAQNDQRRFVGLRRLTEQVLEHIRYLNKVSTSMRAGLIDIDEAAEEIESTERRLHGMIDQLRHYAGVTGSIPTIPESPVGA